MKMILFAESFYFGDYQKDGKEGQYGRLRGKTSSGREVTAFLWGPQAATVDRTFKMLTPEGVEFRDMRFALELEGRERPGKPRTAANGRVYRDKIFSVEEFRILTGPALELHRARATGAAVAARAAELAASGDVAGAYLALKEFVHPFSRFDSDADHDFEADQERDADAAMIASAAPVASPASEAMTEQAAEPQVDAAPDAAPDAAADDRPVDEAPSNAGSATEPSVAGSAAEGDYSSDEPVDENGQQAAAPEEKSEPAASEQPDRGDDRAADARSSEADQVAAPASPPPQTPAAAPATTDGDAPASRALQNAAAARHGFAPGRPGMMRRPGMLNRPVAPPPPATAAASAPKAATVPSGGAGADSSGSQPQDTGSVRAGRRRGSMMSAVHGEALTVPEEDPEKAAARDYGMDLANPGPDKAAAPPAASPAPASTAPAAPTTVTRAPTRGSMIARPAPAATGADPLDDPAPAQGGPVGQRSPQRADRGMTVRPAAGRPSFSGGFGMRR